MSLPNVSIGLPTAQSVLWQAGSPGTGCPLKIRGHDKYDL